MPKVHHLLVMVALLGATGCRGAKTSRFCPKGMSEVRLRSEPGKSVWCEAADQKRAQWIEWHPESTRPRQSCSYYGGRPAGSFTAWHPDGKPWVQGQFADGQKVGKWKQWDGGGNQVAEGDYRGGRLIAGAPVAGIAGCERAAKP